MSKYAAKTDVPVERSRAEIERNLMRYGATAFSYAVSHTEHKAVIQFMIAGRMIKKEIPLPEFDSFKKTPAGRAHRNTDGQLKAWEQACRQRWRAISLAVLAKLEMTEAGVSTIEEEFLADIVLPNQQTLHEHVAPLIEEAYSTGKMPKLLPAFK
jgi:hypothetical protein